MEQVRRMDVPREAQRGGYQWMVDRIEEEGERFESLLGELKRLGWILVAILAVLSVMAFVLVGSARAHLAAGAAVVCEDDYQVLRYEFGDDVKQKVMRAVRTCWTVGTLDEPASTARLEELLDGREDEDE